MISTFTWASSLVFSEMETAIENGWSPADRTREGQIWSSPTAQMVLKSVSLIESPNSPSIASRRPMKKKSETGLISTAIDNSHSSSKLPISPITPLTPPISEGSVSTFLSDNSLAQDITSFESLVSSRKRSPSEPIAARRSARGRTRSVSSFSTDEREPLKNPSRDQHSRSTRGRGAGNSLGGHASSSPFTTTSVDTNGRDRPTTLLSRQAQGPSF